MIAAYITHDRDNGTDRKIADFLKEFDGLSGSQKRSKVLADTDLGRVNLSSLANGEGLDSETIARLLASMKVHTKEVTPRRLGLIGRDHIAQRFEQLGCDPEHLEYSKEVELSNGLPEILETAFGWLGEDAPDKRQIFAGANWSAGINNPFRSFGQTGEGLEAILQEQRVGAREPVVFMIHFVSPRVEYTDRGKSALVIGSKEGS